MTAPLACWRCEEPGHGYADCRRPPPQTRKELDARIDRHVERWDSGYGEISTKLKQEFIRAEKRDYERNRK